MTREEIVKSMSLQDAIEVLKDTNTYGTADIAKSVAIDTMCKYQKIEQIVDKWNEGIYDDEVLKDDSSSENLNKSEIPTGSTTKDDLVGDCISRKQAIRELKESAEHHANDSREEALLRRDRDIIKALPSVTPEEPFMPIPCISSKVCEHDRMVTLDKIRAEIEKLPDMDEAGVFSSIRMKRMVLEIIDKYKVESEVERWQPKVENYSIKMVTNAKDAENYPISEDISKDIEEINKLLFKNRQAESLERYLKRNTRLEWKN